MLLTITTTHTPATDLGFLLHKHPERVHEIALAVGTARVFYPEASDRRCTAALLVEVDPIGLVRGRRRGKAGNSGLLGHYVNDRPYAASSFLSVAIARSFATAMGGRSKERPDLAARAIPLSARVTPLPCRGQEDLPERLFAPLGYQVSTESHLLDPALADWGASSYRTVSLSGQCRLADLLSHLYVLIPVLDADKHYWVGDDEVDKLLRRGEGWLARHPEKELIARRYLKRQAHLTREALARLADDQSEDSDRAREARADEEQTLERPIRLHDLRLETVSAALRAGPARRVLDLGCGEGRLLQMLLRDPQFIEIVGLDTSVRALERARDRLRLERMAPRQRARIQLLHGALTYRDQRLAGYDAAAAVEVVEHLDPPRLAAFERVVFACARPGKLVLTTPNVE